MHDDINPDYINVVTTGKQNCTNGLVNVISYDLMAKLGQTIYDKQFQVIIMVIVVASVFLFSTNFIC